MPSTTADSFNARNNTRVVLILNGQRVGRIQSFSESITNNVQVLAELGREYMVEMKKGITAYSFSIAKFLCRVDVADSLKSGAPFSLMVRDDATANSVDGGGQSETLEYFAACMMTSVTFDYTVGQAAVGTNASVVTIGKGVGAPQLVA